MCDAPIGIFLDIYFEPKVRESFEQHLHWSLSIEFPDYILLLQIPELSLSEFQLLALLSHDGLNLPIFQTRLKESSNFFLLRLRDASVNRMSGPGGGRFVVMLVTCNYKGPGAVCNWEKTVNENVEFSVKSFNHDAWIYLSTPAQHL